MDGGDFPVDGVGRVAPRRLAGAGSRLVLSNVDGALEGLVVEPLSLAALVDGLAEGLVAAITVVFDL